MKKALVRVNWNKSQLKNGINPVLEKYENYLRCRGFRESSILRYKDSIKKYLNKTKSINSPSIMQWSLGTNYSNPIYNTLQLTSILQQ